MRHSSHESDLSVHSSHELVVRSNGHRTCNRTSGAISLSSKDCGMLTGVVATIERFRRLRNNDVMGFKSTRVEHCQITGVQLFFREYGSGYYSTLRLRGGITRRG